MAADPLATQAGNREGLPHASNSPASASGPLSGDTLVEALLQAAPDALLILGGDRRVVMANAQAERLFGFSRQELVGEPIETLLPERFRDRHAEHVSRCFSEPQARPMGAGLELYALRRDGGEFPVEISLSPLATPAGTLVLVAVRDVTERRKAEARFRGLLESAPDPIVIADAGGRIVLVNQETERVFGYERAELLGQSVEILLPEQLRKQHVRHRSGYQASPRTRPMGFGVELSARRKDGSEFPVEISLSPSETEDGTLIISVIRDVTERKRAEAKFRGLLEAAPDPMVISTTGGEIVLVNAQAERVFGESRETLVGRPVEALMPERYRERHVRHRTAYTQAPTVRPMGQGLDLVGKRADGREFPVEISLSPLETEEGLLISSSIRDVSEQRKALEALQRSEALYRSLSELLPDLVWTFRSDGRLGYRNQRWKDYTGLDGPEEGQGADLLHPDDVPLVMGRWAEAVAREEAYEAEARLRRHDGKYRWFLLRAVPISHSDGTAAEWIGTSTDITDRKSAEAQRAAQGARWRLLSEAAAALLTSDDPEQAIRLIFERLSEPLGVDAYLHYTLTKEGDGLYLESSWGIPPDTVHPELPMGRGICGAVAQSRAAGHVTEVQESQDPLTELIRGLGIRAYACQPLLLAGSLLGTLSFASRTRSRFDPDDLELFATVTHYVAIAKERKRLLESERHKSEQLGAAIREAHHRIKNNLQSITDLLSLELDRVYGTDAGMPLQQSMERIQAIAAVHDLLSRDADLEYVDFRQLIERLVPMALRYNLRHDAAIALQLSVVPVRFEAKTATALALVLNELVSNAAKHAFTGRASGVLRVEFSTEGREHQLVVQDDGPGLPDGFDPSADASVGMQVVRTLVEGSLRGTLSLVSAGGLRAEVRVVMRQVEPETRPIPLEGTKCGSVEQPAGWWHDRALIRRARSTRLLARAVREESQLLVAATRSLCDRKPPRTEGRRWTR